MDENGSGAGGPARGAGASAERRNLSRNVRRGVRRSGSAGNIGISGVPNLWKLNVVFMDEIGTYGRDWHLWKRLALMEEKRRFYG